MKENTQGHLMAKIHEVFISKLVMLNYIFNFIRIFTETIIKVKISCIYSYGLLLRRSFLSVYWKDWCWSWNSNTLATLCEELTHLKRPWCWERLKAEGEGDNGGWDDWMASLTQWTWVWVNSGSWWWTGRPGVLQFIGSQRVGHNWVTELNWTSFPSVSTSQFSSLRLESLFLPCK